MQRHGSLIQLLPEWEERYIILHKYVFPEVLAQIRRSNIRNYSIFLRDRMLFAYYEYTGTGFDADMRAMAADPVTQEWWKLTDPTQLPLPTCIEGEKWAEAREVFHYEGDMSTHNRIECNADVIDLKPEHAAEYIRIHQSVPPAVLDRIGHSNIRNYSIYLRDGRLYAYYEYTGTDFSADMSAMAADRETQLWWDITKPQQSPLRNRPEGLWWAPMPEVFHTD